MDIATKAKAILAILFLSSVMYIGYKTYVVMERQVLKAPMCKSIGCKINFFDCKKRCRKK